MIFPLLPGVSPPPPAAYNTAKGRAWWVAAELRERVLQLPPAPIMRSADREDRDVLDRLWHSQDRRVAVWADGLTPTVQALFAREAASLRDACTRSGASDVLATLRKSRPLWNVWSITTGWRIGASFMQTMREGMQRTWAPLRIVKAAKPPESRTEVFLRDLRERGAQRVAGITATTERRLAQALAAGAARKESNDQLAARLAKVYDGFSEGRAKTIARTSVHQSAMYAQWFTATRSEKAWLKTWLTQLDDRVRPMHLGAQGQTTEMDLPYLVGGSELMYPGDDSLGAGSTNTVNCRCYQAFSPNDRLRGGRALAKPKLPRAPRTPAESIAPRPLDAEGGLSAEGAYRELMDRLDEQLSNRLATRLEDEAFFHYPERRGDLLLSTPDVPKELREQTATLAERFSGQNDAWGKGAAHAEAMQAAELVANEFAARIAVRVPDETLREILLTRIQMVKSFPRTLPKKTVATRGSWQYGSRHLHYQLPQSLLDVLHDPKIGKAIPILVKREVALVSTTVTHETGHVLDAYLNLSYPSMTARFAKRGGLPVANDVVAGMNHMFRVVSSKEPNAWKLWRETTFDKDALTTLAQKAAVEMRATGKVRVALGEYAAGTPEEAWAEFWSVYVNGAPEYLADLAKRMPHTYTLAESLAKGWLRVGDPHVAALLKDTKGFVAQRVAAVQKASAPAVAAPAKIAPMATATPGMADAFVTYGWPQLDLTPAQAKSEWQMRKLLKSRSTVGWQRNVVPDKAAIKHIEDRLEEAAKVTARRLALAGWDEKALQRVIPTIEFSTFSPPTMAERHAAHYLYAEHRIVVNLAKHDLSLPAQLSDTILHELGHAVDHLVNISMNLTPTDGPADADWKKMARLFTTQANVAAKPGAAKSWHQLFVTKGPKGIVELNPTDLTSYVGTYSTTSEQETFAELFRCLNSARFGSRQLAQLERTFPQATRFFSTMREALKAGKPFVAPGTEGYIAPAARPFVHVPPVVGMAPPHVASMSKKQIEKIVSDSTRAALKKRPPALHLHARPLKDAIDPTKPIRQKIIPATRGWWLKSFNGPATGSVKTRTGKVAEGIVKQHLQRIGQQVSGGSLTVNNFPIDVIAFDKTTKTWGIIEAKGGLITNTRGAQHWRLTAGEPSKAVQAWLKTASEAETAAYHAGEAGRILARKKAALKIAGELFPDATVKAREWTVLVEPTPHGATVHLYAFDGWHRRIGWNSSRKGLAKAYQGSYEVSFKSGWKWKKGA